MNNPRHLLLQVLRDPRRMSQLDAPACNELLRQARMSKLVARLGYLAQDVGILDAIPPKMAEQMLAARAVSDQHARIVGWEVNRIGKALAGVDTPVVLLKGAAYLLAGMDVARGRLVTDVDILVPADRLGQVESALVAHGWESMKVDPYDQRYYRAWMHELPPMQHTQRHSVLDVHHTILPVTGRLSPDPQLLLAAARTINPTHDAYLALDTQLKQSQPAIQVLAPADMVIHAAVHMFQDGELAGAVRDLADIAAMVHQFDGDASFWERLVPRAEALGLQRPLYYALASAVELLGTEVPESVMRTLGPARPIWPLRRLMALLVARALVPQPTLRNDLAASTARLALYIRSHWLRMPPGMLARHLYEKAIRRWRSEPET